jgi:16S rRNA (adenine1518-N6/adenine1519-N6)-dimethyltransferase
VIRRHGLSARHRLGQNFLLDPTITRRIADAAGPFSNETVIEVGPGPGGLTRALLGAGAKRVLAVERDARCIAALTELDAAYPGRIEIVEADARTIDEATLAPAPRCVVANLPYNVATPLLIRWLARIDRFSRLTLMFQKEVAARITAAPRTSAYGRLSVMAQWRTRPRALFDLPPGAFVPAPKVTSTLVSFTPLAEPVAGADWDALETVVAAAFNQRRKMLRSALKKLGPDSQELLQNAGIASERRAEELNVAEFCALARSWRARTDAARS